MEFKGTKGNWDYVYENNQFEVFNEPEKNGDFITIAICENKANALLISKAPEMLEMLKRCERTLREVYEVETTEIKQLIKEATISNEP